jgi:hypothetical protein
MSAASRAHARLRVDVRDWLRTAESPGPFPAPWEAPDATTLPQPDPGEVGAEGGAGGETGCSAGCTGERAGAAGVSGAGAVEAALVARGAVPVTAGPGLGEVAARTPRWPALCVPLEPGRTAEPAGPSTQLSRVLAVAGVLGSVAGAAGTGTAASAATGGGGGAARSASTGTTAPSGGAVAPVSATAPSGATAESAAGAIGTRSPDAACPLSVAVEAAVPVPAGSVCAEIAGWMPPGIGEAGPDGSGRLGEVGGSSGALDGW